MEALLFVCFAAQSLKQMQKCAHKEAAVNIRLIHFAHSYLREHAHMHMYARAH